MDDSEVRKAVILMVSEKFMVNSDAQRMAAARYATENFAWQAGLDRKDTLRLDLLVEETLGMIKAMLDEFYGQVWFVGNGKTCEIHFEATADMNSNKKEELLSMSSSGKNASAKGFMAKLGDVISGAMHSAGRTIDTYGEETIRYGVVYSPGMMTPSADMTPIWTLQDYKNDLDKARGEDAEVDEMLDELEKSIVARLADDIVVGVKGDRVDLIITKKF